MTTLSSQPVARNGSLRTVLLGYCGYWEAGKETGCGRANYGQPGRSEEFTATRSAATTRRPRPTSRPTPAPQLAPSTTDTPVTAPDAAQLTLPIVAPELLARARHVARQYRTEHGTPITPGQLAVRLKVTSEQATQALAVLDLDPNNQDRPTQTVNGHRPATRATR
jgi:hypothetical protein